MNKRVRGVVCWLAVAACAGWLVCGLTQAKPKRQAPPPRSRAEVEAVLAKAPRAPAAEKLRELNVVLLASKKDHGPNEHDYPLWQKRWKVLLAGKQADDEPKVNCFCPEPQADRQKVLAGAPKVKITCARDWPSKEQIGSADLLVMFSKPRWNPKTLGDLQGLLDRGGGFVMMHMAIWQHSKELAAIVGMAAQKGTKYRHGWVELKIAEHPITLGLPKTVRFHDETYYNFQGDPSQVTVVATCDEKVGGQTRPEPMFWARQCGKGRVFVCILGHFMWTFDDPYFRVLMLRGMAWAAGESPYRFDDLVLRGAPLREAASASPEPKKTAAE